MVGRRLLYTSASCVVANSMSLASPQAAKLTHFVAPPFPTKSLILRGAPSASRILLLKNPTFVLWLTSQNPPDLLPRKSVCCYTLSCCRVRRQPLSASAGSKGITHQTFLRKIVCQQGGSRPYWKPSGKEIFPLKSLIFLAGAYTNCKMQLVMPAQKM